MTEAWAPSPSPSLDAFESSSALLVGWHVACTLPSRFWDAYIAYLWSYQPSSWVGRVASSFRIFAIILVLPVVLLTLLDVTSYVIVRTLGVVDDVKASSGEPGTTADGSRSNDVAVTLEVPLVVPTISCGCESEETSSDSTLPRGAEGRLAPEEGSVGQLHVPACEPERVCGDTPRVGGGSGGGGRAYRGLGLGMGQIRAADQQMGVGLALADGGGVNEGEGAGEGGSDASSQGYYFVGDADLRLAGEGVFSPAVSMPPSPLTPHMPMHAFGESDGRGSGHVSEEEGIVLRRRVQGERRDAVRS